MCVGWGVESGGGSGTPGIPHRRLSRDVAMSLFEEFVKTPDVLEALRGLRFRSERAWDDAHALSDAAVRRVLLLGDIHDSSRVFEAAMEAAIAEGCDVLVQVGDFWLQDSTWRSFAPEEAALMWAAVNCPIPVVVVDGNHEVWPCLQNFLHRYDTLAALQHGRPLHLGGSLWWADRGSTWTWAGRRFGALGGSASPDRWIAKVAPYRWAPGDHHTTRPRPPHRQHRRRTRRARMPRRSRSHPGTGERIGLRDARRHRTRGDRCA